MPTAVHSATFDPLVVRVPVDRRVNDEFCCCWDAGNERQISLLDGAAPKLGVHVSCRLQRLTKDHDACKRKGNPQLRQRSSAKSPAPRLRADSNPSGGSCAV